MEILVLEDNLVRLKFFIEVLGRFKLTIVDNVEEAKTLLESNSYDMIFMDNNLGNGGFGADLAAYLASLSENPNTDSLIVVHCLDDVAQKQMLKMLTPKFPKTIGVKFGDQLSQYLGLTN